MPSSQIEGVDPEYAVAVGARLRTVRRQKRLSLQAVEKASRLEFKASVLGAYERGERTISVAAAPATRELYRVPVDQLLRGCSRAPSAGRGVAFHSNGRQPGHGKPFKIASICCAFLRYRAQNASCSGDFSRRCRSNVKTSTAKSHDPVRGPASHGLDARAETSRPSSSAGRARPASWVNQAQAPDNSSACMCTYRSARAAVTTAPSPTWVGLHHLAGITRTRACQLSRAYDSGLGPQPRSSSAVGPFSAPWRRARPSARRRPSREQPR